MDENTIGVSKSGMEQIKADIKLKLLETGAITKLKDFWSVDRALRDMWVGDDCETYISNLNTSIDSVCDALRGYSKQIDAKLDEIYESWVSFQGSNVVQK